MPACGQAQADAVLPDAAAALLRAYPGTLEKAAAGEIVAKSGVRIPIGTGHAADPWPQLLDNADILDMFAKPYAAGKPAAAPRHNDDGPLDQARIVSATRRLVESEGLESITMRRVAALGRSRVA